MRLKDVWTEFQKYIAAHWSKGHEESEMEALLRTASDARSVFNLLDAKGWDVVQRVFSKKFLDDVNLLRLQMLSGQLSDEALKMRMAGICSKVEFMETIREILDAGEAAEEKLKTMATKQTEQAEMPSVENLAAEG